MILSVSYADGGLQAMGHAPVFQLRFAEVWRQAKRPAFQFGSEAVLLHYFPPGLAHLQKPSAERAQHGNRAADQGPGQFI